jgi:hypothetical protein
LIQHKKIAKPLFWRTYGDHMSFSLTDLNTFTTKDLQSICESSELTRQSLSNDVISLIQLPRDWQVTAEFRGEWGGLFPVQCRFTPKDNDSLIICLCSPGELSYLWSLLLASSDGHIVRLLSEDEIFNPTSIEKVLFKVAGMCRFGCTASTIAAFLEAEYIE